LPDRKFFENYSHLSDRTGILFPHGLDLGWSLQVKYHHVSFSKMNNFSDYFNRIANYLPFPFQSRFATEPQLAELLNVPTASGKTATVVLGWLWRRRFAPSEIRNQTPRRLIYCLPMRTLVEQTYNEAEKWLKNAGLMDEVGLHMLMGGAVSDRWDADPEKDCILIGTQDQLVSRALNRGYSMSRYRWPIHFALLNNDCLWVFDETQSMGASLKTSAQLQGFREKLGAFGPVRSLWVSATLDDENLATVDFRAPQGRIELADDDLENDILQRRVNAEKSLAKAKTAFNGSEKDYLKPIAQEIADAHQSGKTTIVICNRVSRAQEVYRSLQKLKLDDDLLLVHGRFRSADRNVINQKVGKGEKTFKGIIVATQAIEAGVDITSSVMFTELAPWSSMVQRFGRCNRYGEDDSAQVYWIDFDLEKKGIASPYQVEDLKNAREQLQQMTDVGPASLKGLDIKMTEEETLIPRRSDLMQLFDTSVDLAGHDIDVSPFIRDSDETDVAVVWRQWEGEKPPENFGELQRDEICRVGLYSKLGKDFFERVRKERLAWVRDRLTGDWGRPTALYPGMTLLVKCDAGGYDASLGFTGNVADKAAAVELPTIEPDLDGGDRLTQVGRFVSLKQHGSDVAAEVEAICQKLNLDLPTELLARAGSWHDYGKAHPVFQNLLTLYAVEPYKSGGPWAKSDRYGRMKERPGFRHELVSALVALGQGEPFLLVYLVAAHHGKVRMMIQPRSHEKKPLDDRLYALGVWDQDGIPAVEITLGKETQTIPAQLIDLSCMQLGTQVGNRSWAEQSLDLLAEYGPFKLAFLESVIRIGDWRASQRYSQQDLLGGTEA
jgi:CRISPR-associated endonuclease/helicase Cas3